MKNPWNSETWVPRNKPLRLHVRFYILSLLFVATFLSLLPSICSDKVIRSYSKFSVIVGADKSNHPLSLVSNSAMNRFIRNAQKYGNVYILSL